MAGSPGSAVSFFLKRKNPHNIYVKFYTYFLPVFFSPAFHFHSISATLFYDVNSLETT